MFDFNNLRTNYIEEMEKLPYGDAVLVLPGGALQQVVRLQHMVECIGLDTIAMKVVNQSDFLQGFDRITRQAQELLVEYLLNEHKGELQYFGPLLGKKGFVKELTGLFTEFRRCNLHSGDELAAIFDNWLEESGHNGYALAPAPVTKNADVALLFGAYIEWFNNPEHKVYDVEGLYMLAREMLSSGQAKLPYKKIFVSDFMALTPVEEEFVKALHPDGQVTWGAEDHQKIIVPEGMKIGLDVYASHREELEGALRIIATRIKAGAVPGDFMLVVKNLDGFSGVKYAAEKFGVPVTLPRMDKLSQHPLTSELLDNLGEGSSFAEFLSNARKFLNEQQFEQKLGKQYTQDNSVLSQLQNACAVRRKLFECLDNLEHTLGFCSFLHGKISRQTFVKYFQDAARKVSYVINPGDDDGVLLVNAINALGYQRKYLYILGVNEGEWPAPLRENWIYTDLERKSMKFDMGICLPTAMEHYLNDNRTFNYLLTTAMEEIHCSWTVADNMERSVYIEEVPKCSKAVPEDHRGYRVADTVILSRSLCELQQVAGVDTLRQGVSSYNGSICPVIPEDGVLQLSASQLLQYVKCPFAYMVQRVWWQRDEECGKDELAPYEVGNLVHEVIRTFYEKLTKEYGKHPGLVKLTDGGVPEKKELLAILRQVFDDKKIELLAQKDDLPVLKKQVERAFKLLEVWLNMELSEQSQYIEMRPMAVEEKFDDLEPVQNLPCRVIFNGVIDRVDAFYATVPSDDDPKLPKQILKGYYISDYKTGKAPSGKDNVQLPLYALALNKIMGEDDREIQHPVAGSYISLSDNAKRSAFVPKGQGNLDNVLKKCLENPEAILQKTDKHLQDFITNVLKPNLEALLAGNFAIPDNPRGCDYCAFKSICRRTIVAGEVSEDE